MDIQIPTWRECDERLDIINRSDRTIMQCVMSGSELTPLENMVHAYDDSDPNGSAKFIADVKALVDWCINNPDQVAAHHEKI